MKRVNRASLGGIVALVLFVLSLPTFAQPSFTNGSLTGPVATGSAPPGWFNWQKTPDTVNALGPFNNTVTAWTLSPDGGTFVRGGGSDFLNSEAIAQNVGGFSLGATYDITFFLTNLGFQHPTSGAWNGEDGYWELVVDGTVVDSSIVLSKQAVAADPVVWFGDTFSFVATSATHELAFVSRSATGSLAAYMGIDGLKLRAVPAPGVFSSVVIVGAIGLRRRRE